MKKTGVLTGKIHYSKGYDTNSAEERVHGVRSGGNQA